MTALAVSLVVMLLMGQHDVCARLREMTIPGEGSVIYGQYQAGMAGQVSLPGGAVKTMAYDPLSGMVSNRVVDASGNPVMDRMYQRNRTGGITGMNTEHGNYTYSYDQIDQLTDVGDPVLPDQSFSYDPAGNRVTSGRYPKPGIGDPEVRTYAVNNLNQYLSVTSASSAVSLSYDLNGNVLVRRSLGEGGTQTTETFTWDTENRLVAFSNSANGISASYYYDPFGRRLRKVVNGVTNWYVYADEGLVMEMDGAGNEIRSYGYAPDSLWMNDPLYMRVPGVGTTNIYYFLNDHLGAPQKLIAKNGEVVWNMDSEVFGEAMLSPDSIITNNLRFSSQYFDEESGLHYNTQRYYGPDVGRYVSRDPLLEERSSSSLGTTYVAFDNDGVNRSDLLGLLVFEKNECQGCNAGWTAPAPQKGGYWHDPVQTCANNPGGTWSAGSSGGFTHRCGQRLPWHVGGLCDTETHVFVRATSDDQCCKKWLVICQWEYVGSAEGPAGADIMVKPTFFGSVVAHMSSHVLPPSVAMVGPQSGMEIKVVGIPYGATVTVFKMQPRVTLSGGVWSEIAEAGWVSCGAVCLQ